MDDVECHDNNKIWSPNLNSIKYMKTLKTEVDVVVLTTDDSHPSCLCEVITNGNKMVEFYFQRVCGLLCMQYCISYINTLT